MPLRRVNDISERGRQQVREILRLHVPCSSTRMIDLTSVEFEKRDSKIT